MPRCHRRARRGTFRGFAAGSVVARGDPPLPAAALRARGLAFEVGPDDLRMDADEAARLLGGAGVDLPGIELAELIATRGGLARGPVPRRAVDQGRGGNAKGAATFAGSDRLVADYLRSECWRTCRRTSFASSREPRFSSGCRARSATPSSSRAVPRRSWSRWSVPTCSWCAGSRSGSGTATTISSRSCSVRSWSRPSPTWCLGSRPARDGVRQTGSWRRPSVRTGGRGRRPSGEAVRAVRPARLSERPCRDHRALARLAGGDGAMERNAAVAASARRRRDLGPAGGGGTSGRCGRARELRRRPARRQRLGRLVAGHRACPALS